MRARQESCCFTGHRPNKLPWGYHEEDPRCAELKKRMSHVLEAVYQEGYRHFICGMAQGCDTYFCECALALRQIHPDVTVEAAIPCPTQAAAWPAADRRRYEHLVAQCDFETVVSAQYSSSCMQRRDRYMVDHASLMIVAFDGSSGGTFYTVQYALRRGLELIDLSIPATGGETADAT